MNDDDADRLAEVAVQLVSRVREEDPAATGRWLANTLGSSDDWFRLCFVLAAAVPDNRPWLHLTAWTTQPRPVYRDAELLPCGTRAAYLRHRAHGQEPCDPCVEANREYDRDRKREAYHASKEDAA